VSQKKMFKVLAMFPFSKSGGERGTRWMRVGTGFENRDASINIVLDVIPKNFEIQLREFDEEELRKRDQPVDPSAFVRSAVAPLRAPAATVDPPPY
jgi:hypothetical protein